MELTAGQKEAIGQAEGNMAITAAAGAGKTFVLTEIVHRLVHEQGVAPAEVVVVTFTEKAAGELKARIAKRLEQPISFLEDCPIGTIHSFATGLLRERAKGLPRDFLIWEEHRASLERSRIVHEELRLLLEKPTEDLASLFEEYGWGKLAGVLTEQLGMRWKMTALESRDVAESQWPAFLTLYAHMKQIYTDHKRRHGALDFEDLEEEALALLAMPEEQRQLQDQFRHILVDEYQDISPPQYELINRLHDSRTNRLIIVGDPRQSIYRFRGADVALFEQTQTELQEAGAPQVELLTNFRSTISLIAQFNQIFATVFADSYHPMQGVRDLQQMDPLQVFELPKTSSLAERRATEAERIAAYLKELLAETYDPSDVGILFRSRPAMADYEAALAKKEIPFRSQSGNLLLEQQEVLDQLNVMRSLAHPQDNLALAGVMRSPLGGIGDASLWPCANRSLVACLDSAPSVPDEEKKSWHDFAEWWRRLSQEAPYLKASEIAHRCFQRARGQGVYAGGQARANLRHWIQFLEWMEQVDPFELKDLLAVVEGFRDDGARILEVPADEETEEAVRLMTVHAAKGLEFPIVVIADLCAAIPSPRAPILIDVTAGVGMRRLNAETRGLRDEMIDTEDYLAVKESLRTQDIAESKRLLYVACTRAKDQLIVSLDRHRKEKQATWNKWLCEALSA